LFPHYSIKPQIISSVIDPELSGERGGSFTYSEADFLPSWFIWETPRSCDFNGGFSSASLEEELLSEEEFPRRLALLFSFLIGS
jgi:hypothetical protein